MTAEEFIAAFAERIGAPAPDEAQLDAVLRLASVAAHASERKAAPVACWLAGAAGMSLAEAEAAARALAGEK
jgi:hypothetical protein